MNVVIVPRAVTTDDLLQWANQYVQMYDQNMKSEQDKQDLYFRVADFLKFVAQKANAQTEALLNESKKVS